MSIAASKRFRSLLVGLLVLCLLPTAMTAHWLDALHNSAVDSKPVLFIAALSNAAASDIVSIKRSRLTSYPDNLLKATLVSERTLILFIRALPSFFEDNDSVVHRIDISVIPVRAPPIYRFSLS